MRAEILAIGTELLMGEIINRNAAWISRLSGEYFFAEDDETLEENIGQLLVKIPPSPPFGKGGISVAESCTGGLVSSRLTDVSGSSAYIQANIVTYSDWAKVQFLGVKPETLALHGAVSAETALEMAAGVRAMSGAVIGLSLTGIAGPLGGSPEKPVGLLYVGLCGVDGVSMVQEYRAPSWNRKEVKYWFSQCALHFLYQYLKTIN